MKEEFCKFIEENELSPFSQNKTQLGLPSNSIYKTRDGKSVHNKVLSQISANFNFSDSSNLWQCLGFTNDINEIKRRQDFFKTLDFVDTNFFSKLRNPRPVWSPKYGVVAVTEDEETFVKLNELGCEIKFLNSDMDLSDLDNYEIVQVINCDNFSRALESLPQSVFIDSVEDVYLERYLEFLSGWKDNLLVLDKSLAGGEIKQIISELLPLFVYFEESASKIVKREEVDKILEEINDKIGAQIKDMMISGSSLMKMLGEGKLPEEFQKIINESIEGSKIPKYVFNVAIPVSIDEKELDSLIKRQSSTEFSDLAEEIKSKAELLKSIPKKLQRISNLLIVTDFLSGVYEYMKTASSFPEISEEVYIEDSKNYFLEAPQPINFYLTNSARCSILTGANSGGKTTLLEHFIQLISLFQLGLPVNGKFKSPLFSEIYYFAKNKGAANKGAFENLLTQMSEIKPGKQTLILADEIEAVTEPGVAGKIIASTAEYFLNKNCVLVIATHLGYEIKEVLPAGARIDGIEAKGLDKDFNLIVDHNPVIGRLANSTPELIVEKMASLYQLEYFKHLNERLKGNHL